ncbi:MAG: glycosyltransferase 87 family protein, partial [SAR324 cluster bacterium]|nr:glycosyltransferase 87 family protein [SAR324 cluster bacterium]
IFFIFHLKARRVKGVFKSQFYNASGTLSKKAVASYGGLFLMSYIASYPTFSNFTLFLKNAYSFISAAYYVYLGMLIKFGLFDLFENRLFKSKFYNSTFGVALRADIEKFHLVLISLAIVLVGYYFQIQYNLFYADLRWPYDYFLFKPHLRFGDFNIIVTQGANLNPYFQGFGVAPYFPFAYFTAYLLNMIHSSLSIYLLFFFFALGIAGLAKQIQKDQGRFGVVALLLLMAISYPVLFAFDRGNLEILVFALMAYFCLQWRDRPIVADIFLSLAISMKAFPAVLLLVLLKDFKIKRIIIIVGLSSCITILSAMLFEGGIWKSFLGWQYHYTRFVKEYAVGNSGFYYGHSIWGMVKSYVIFTRHGVSNMAEYLHNYNIFSAITLVLIALFAFLKVKKDWQVVFLMVSLVAMLPPVSSDYRLIQFLIPMSMFFGAKNKEPVRSFFYMLLFALLLMPKNYSINLAYHWLHLPKGLFFGQLVNPSIIFLFVLTIVVENFRNPIDFPKLGRRLKETIGLSTSVDENNTTTKSRVPKA